MKISVSKLNTVTKKIAEGRIIACLLYGPDKGLIQDVIEKIKKTLHIQTIVSMDYSNLLINSLYSTLSNKTIFGGRDLVNIRDCTSSIDSDLRQFILNEKIYHFPVFVSDGLDASSSIRKFFESDDRLLSIGCYSEDENAVLKFVSQEILRSKKTIDKDGLKLLVRRIQGDRLNIKNELDKLLMFTADKHKISLDDVTQSVVPTFDISADKLSVAFVLRDSEIYFNELDALLTNNIPGIWIIRAVIRYCINMYVVHEKMSSNITLQDAVNAIKPPIFFKYLGLFKSTISKTKKEEVLKLISLLNKAEIELKSSNRKDADICSMLFFEAFHF